MIQVQLKLRPTRVQERTFQRWLWHLTAVWNWTVRKLEADANAGIPRSQFSLSYLVRGHSERIGLPRTVLMGTIRTAYASHRRFVTGVSRCPRLKSRRRPLSSIAFAWWDQGNTPPKVRGNRVWILGMGPVRFHRQEIPAGHVGQARIVRRASGWYLCLFVQTDPKPITPVADGEVGIDPGFSSLLTLSTGEKIEHPHELAAEATRLAQAQRGGRKALSARIHERIRNRRKNRNHHLSRRLVAENGLIAFSADPHRSIARRFGKSVSSSGHFQLRQQLAYKSLAGGRRFVEVPSRNSTRTCSACGALSGPSGWRGLSVRIWDCCACGARHDRDVNAAVNALRSGRGIRHKNRREAVPGIAI